MWAGGDNPFFLEPPFSGPLLADDWLCTRSGYVTEIHFWGSWRDDQVGNLEAFLLAIYSDQSADDPDNPFDYSHPHEKIWPDFAADFVEVTVYETEPMPPSSQGWYDPLTGEIISGDHSDYFQYSIYLQDILPEEQWFQQEEGTIYWLVLYPRLVPPYRMWGWKSSLNHWNDDAVWGNPLLGIDWEELYEPLDFLQSLDLAFMIDGPDGPELDYGDAPCPPYPTTKLYDGARHVADWVLYMGALEDVEPNGLQDPDALGDDNNNLDDEDGVVFTSGLIKGQQATVDVTASAPGFLDAWLDFNDDGDWADPNEQIFTSQALIAGVNSLSFQVPGSAIATDETFSRWRFSSTGGLAVTGFSNDGEVEDYAVEIQSAAVLNK